ncbi:hypothetical protein [Streptomyces sp. NPDC005148]
MATKATCVSRGLPDLTPNASGSHHLSHRYDSLLHTRDTQSGVRLVHPTRYDTRGLISDQLHPVRHLGRDQR